MSYSENDWLDRRSTPLNAVLGATRANRHKARRCSAGPVSLAGREASVACPDEIFGIVFNNRAHRNARLGRIRGDTPPKAFHAAPETKLELDRTLALFAERRTTTLVIDGGDGTVSDVISRIHRHFGDALPRLALVPSGKTNALALDLGIPRDWTVRDALQAAAQQSIACRSPVEIRYEGEEKPRLRGFLFGAGAFRRATALAQGVHRAGAFNGLAIGLSVAGAIGQTLFGSRQNAWRRGEPMLIDLPDCGRIERNFYLLMGSTLERLPLGLKPFGRVRGGLKLLGVDAPPRSLALCVPGLLGGLEGEWLARRGYHRADVDSVRLRLASDFVLDGEVHGGGAVTISRGAPVEFLVPPR